MSPDEQTNIDRWLLLDSVRLVSFMRDLVTNWDDLEKENASLFSNRYNAFEEELIKQGHYDGAK